MDEKQHRFLSLSGQLPARLTVEQVAWLLNCPPHAIAALMAARLLKPLGNPPVNGIKFFCTADVLEDIKDRSWLTKVTNTIIQHTKDHNDRNKDRPAKASRNGHPTVLTFSATAAEG
jgi:hypothetical protein